MLTSKSGMKRKIYLLHPDLGLGGAERFIVDVALELKKLQYEVFKYIYIYIHTHV